MGRISDIVPPLYYSGKNNAKGFIDALDVEINLLEKKIRELPDIIDVDKCPDDKLPYLAALTNAPLVGDNPVLRRRQIRNWPYLLKIKGTERSLEVYLNSIGATDHHISTYFRDANGEYTEDKPDGEPFIGDDGQWRNARTHYFGIETTWNNNHYLTWRDWHDEFIELIWFWLKRLKPFHSELLKWNTFIKDEASLNLYTGAGTFRASIHEIDIVKPKSDTETQLITVGVGEFQGREHYIPITRPEPDIDFKFNCGCGIFRVIHVHINKGG